MMMLHKLLYKNNKYKFLGVVIFEVIIAFLNFTVIRSFLNEDSGLSLFLLIGILQFINIVSYSIFRLIYKQEVISFKQDEIHMFITKRNTRKTMIINKLFQIFLFYIYQFIFSVIVVAISKSNINEIKIVALNLVISLVVFLVFIINDMAVVNEYRKSHFDGIANIAFFVSIFGLGYNPHPILGITAIVSLVLSAIINFILMMKGECKVD